jgi:aryl-alcohol dehydrogenase-like predicted oxidoreductase
MTSSRRVTRSCGACKIRGCALPNRPHGRRSCRSRPGEDIGTHGHRRANNPRFTEDNLARDLALLRPLEEIGQAHGAKPAQAALAWVLSRGENVIPIPGMKRRTRLDENVAAVDIELAPDELARLDAAFPPGAAAGERYTPEVARWAGR